MIKTSGSNIVIEGPLFSPNWNVTLRKNLYSAVEHLTEKGVPLVIAGIKTKNGTGQTASLVEPHVYYRTSFRGAQVGSLYGKVRMKPKQYRDPPGGTAKYPSERVPYIVAAVLESGTYRRISGSQKELVLGLGKKARVRTRKRTHVLNKRRGLWMFRRGTKALQAEAKGIVESLNLVKGLT